MMIQQQIYYYYLLNIIYIIAYDLFYCPFIKTSVKPDIGKTSKKVTCLSVFHFLSVFLYVK